jgi:transcriptional regulator with XRE-family HTH domain
MSLYRLAALTGISRQGIINLEQPDADPKLSTVEKVAKALGVGVVELLADAPPSAATVHSRAVDRDSPPALYEQAAPLIKELKHWGNASRYEQAPSELLKIATKLERLLKPGTAAR